ncbi:ABC transporter ATP-binding protein, partial [Phenylobacterium aquaticum]|uniref:ABC transporter transmembrane domain-containing protein n=1 Tax=Phenylobacterium aquaticum TaxID=1763816 RepID=UPI0026F0EBD2
MTDHYEDTDDSRDRVLPNAKVMGFIARFWLRRRGLLAGTIAFSLLAIGFDLATPWAAGRLVDALAAGPGAAGGVWAAWAVFLAVYLGFSLSWNTAPRFWIPLAARNMAEMTDEGFAKVQSFSADWHADTFAGSTVRRLSRAMWGYDVVSDAVVMWLTPAFLVLIGLSVMMFVRWPMVGLFSAGIVVLYVASNLLLTARYARPLNLKSVAFDSRIGGALADSITSNPTVRSFGAEDRESARIGGVTQAWSLAAARTWTAFTNVWLVQNLILVGLQAGLTGLVIRLWARGAASTGDVAFAITSFMLMSGYLRNIGDQIRMTQKGLDDVEDAARYAGMAPQVADLSGAPALIGQLGEIVFDRVTFGYKAAEAPLYRDFSLTIAPGKKVA